MQRFANRELLSARNLDNVRPRYIEGVVNDLVEQMAGMEDAGELVSPTDLTARSNSTLMFRSIFGREEEAGGEFHKLRDELLEHGDWIFANATAANLADYIPWLRFLPNGGVREARSQSEIGTAIITALVQGAHNRHGWTCQNLPAWPSPCATAPSAQWGCRIRPWRPRRSAGTGFRWERRYWATSTPSTTTRAFGTLPTSTSRSGSCARPTARPPRR